MRAKNELQQISEAYHRVLVENSLESILPSLQFKETTKQAKQYQYIDSSGWNPQLTGKAMPAMSYTVATEKSPVVTVTSDGKETQNVAEPNDIIMSGPSKEQYVVKAEKFPSLYDGKIGQTVIPEQGARIVARVDNITQPVTFTAPWGEDMILKKGDYLVKDADQGYYRIAQKEYDETYNALGEDEEHDDEWNRAENERESARDRAGELSDDWMRKDYESREDSSNANVNLKDEVADIQNRIEKFVDSHFEAEDYDNIAKALHNVKTILSDISELASDYGDRPGAFGADYDMDQSEV